MKRILFHLVICVMAVPFLLISCSKDRGHGAGMLSEIIESGTFLMGCNERLDTYCSASEKPSHLVTLGSFKMDVNEVTVNQYERCIKSNVCKNEAGKTAMYHASQELNQCNLYSIRSSDHPMNCVTHHGAQTFCNWLDKRLPTEAEWEYAARGKNASTWENQRIYPWGNTAASACSQAVTGLARYGCGTNSTYKIAQIGAGASPFGMFDMIGNVSEWVSDYYSSTYYKSQISWMDPAGPSSGNYYAIKGGSWKSMSMRYVRISTRNLGSPTKWSASIGFRCAQSIDENIGGDLDEEKYFYSNLFCYDALQHTFTGHRYYREICGKGV